MSEKIKIEEIQIKPLLAQLKCSCDKYQVDSYSRKSLDANKFEHFKQEGHQAINTMQEETP
jgi:hypothetical protein